MVKSELLQELCNQNSQLIRKDIKKILKIIFSEIIEALRRDENVEIRKFGRISTKIQKSRIGRNPKTGEQIQIAASRKVKWKMSKILYKRLNKNFAEDKIPAINKK